MDRQAFRRVLAGTGGLYTADEGHGRSLLGSCFSIVDPTVFVTAAHCIPDSQNISINHFGGPSPDLVSPVRSVARVPNTDIAILRIDASGRWAQPFQSMRLYADFGEEVCAMGFTPDYLPGSTSSEAVRIFRGFVQRPFLFRSDDFQYSALELSFPCPPGLSGGPLFSVEDPSMLLGVVTGTFETFTTPHEVFVEETAKGMTRYEGRSIVSYGIAECLTDARPQLEEILECQFPPDSE